MSAVHQRTAHRCSFCAKHQNDVEHLIAGPGAYICNECVELSRRVMAGEPLEFPALDEQSDEALLADVANIAASRDQVEEAVADRVRRLRARRVTWARIGETLGVSRQTAWERFSTDAD